eukprot:6185841-Pleurochrysis_carterae.AAC.2
MRVQQTTHAEAERVAAPNEALASAFHVALDMAIIVSLHSYQQQIQEDHKTCRFSEKGYRVHHHYATSMLTLMDYRERAAMRK